MCSGVGWQKFNSDIIECRGFGVTRCIVQKKENITLSHLHDQIETLEPLLKDNSSHPCLCGANIVDVYTWVKVGDNTPRSLGLSNNHWLAFVRPINIGAECNS